jgi:hypothetical protein
MGHECRIENSSAVCYEVNNELWVKEYADSGNKEGRTYQVKFCPECGYTISYKQVLYLIHEYS